MDRTHVYTFMNIKYQKFCERMTETEVCMQSKAKQEAKGNQEIHNRNFACG